MSDTSSRLPGAIVPWLGLGLVLSLALNMFFIGTAVGGRAASEGWAARRGGHFGAEMPMPPPRHHRGGPNLDPRAFARMLPESARDDARTAFEARAPEIRELFGAAMEARAAMLDAMRTEPFDSVALVEAMAASRAADEAAEAAIHNMVAEIVAGLSAEERALIGQDLRERFPEFHERRERRRRH